MLHTQLWQENQDLVQACREHPFVRGLVDGTLPTNAFRRYIAQDAFYLRAFAQAYALILARATDVTHIERLHELIGGVLAELRLHRSCAQQLGIDLNAVQPLPACRAYVNFLRRVAWHQPPGHAVAALTPCARLYAHLGQHLSTRDRPDHPYGEWIRTYSSPEFEALARTLEGLLDDLARDEPAVHDAYRYAMQCELDFFSAPLETAA